MQIEIFRNYGSLLSNTYSYGGPASDAVCSDSFFVLIPEEFECFENCYGELLLQSPWGQNYLINELLCEWHGRPAFYAVLDSGSYFSYLKEV